MSANPQIGWSTESKLLQRILKELERLAGVSSGVATGSGGVATNSTTTALSAATLNSTYPSATTGFRVICPSISGGALTYTKTGTSTWASSPLTNVP